MSELSPKSGPQRTLECLFIDGGIRQSVTYLQRQRWSHFLRQPVKVDSPMKRTIHHEDAETVFG